VSKIILKGIAIFFLLIVATSTMMDISQASFGTVDFWQKHGVFFLFFVSIFPRLTLLFSSVATGGFFWWLGFFFCPRILVAGLATMAYFHTNPILVVISWLVAFGGELFEKTRLGKGRFVFRTTGFSRPGPFTHQDEPAYRPYINKKNDAIEAEFTQKD
jgi:hypothetical protein